MQAAVQRAQMLNGSFLYRQGLCVPKTTAAYTAADNVLARQVGASVMGLLGAWRMVFDCIDVWLYGVAWCCLILTLMPYPSMLGFVRLGKHLKKLGKRLMVSFSCSKCSMLLPVWAEAAPQLAKPVLEAYDTWQSCSVPFPLDTGRCAVSNSTISSMCTCLSAYFVQGSLRQALNQHRLSDPSNPQGPPAVHMVLSLAHDVACALLHLHTENLIHADLKASNVLLTKTAAEPLPPAAGSSGGSGRQQQQQGWGVTCAALIAAAGSKLTAKVADFGLSLSLSPGDTHVSHMHAVGVVVECHMTRVSGHMHAVGLASSWVVTLVQHSGGCGMHAEFS